VSEAAAGPTNLPDYDSTYSCSNGFSGNGTNISISVVAGQTITCTFTNIRKLPLLTVLKSADKATVNPSEVITYTVQITNTGNGKGTNILVHDILSPFTAFGLDAFGTGIQFISTDSSPASGLSLGPPEYSKDHGVTWDYSPISGGGNAPLGYDGNITNWRIRINGEFRPGGIFTLYYKAIVK
jgi:uncharacterized repeat protein (TIGR01451 family)